LTAAALQFENATLALAGRTVLSAVNLVIEEGEFIGVLGPNGAGKTTLLRAALGLVPPKSGTIKIMGHKATRGNPAVGYMPQVHGRSDGVRLTGFDFVASAASGFRWGLPLLSPAERHDVERSLDMVGAGDLAKRSLSEMSGGERQRLLLCQALLGQPKLLLLDEPLISLDPKHQRGVVELVGRVQKELGIAVLFTAHELNPLLNVMDRVLYLAGGRAVVGRVDEVITGPVLSRLYGSTIEVVRLGGRIFVMVGEFDLGHEAHRHEHDGQHHDEGTKGSREHA
jgi:zinc/manganese transport system ATP-binding protein